MHPEAPDAGENVPGAHAVQLWAPPNEKLPAAHAVQLEEPTGEYKPAGQAMQLEAPAGEYEPAGQLTHVADVEAPTTDDEEPAAQAVQIEEPGVGEYEPAPHATQYKAPDSEKEPAAQLTHVEKKAAPTADEEVPAAHNVQLEAPAEGE